MIACRLRVENSISQVSGKQLQLPDKGTPPWQGPEPCTLQASMM